MLVISTMQSPIMPPPEPEPVLLTPQAQATANLPRASIPKMTLDPEPAEAFMSAKVEPVGFYTYELTHELPMKCSGMCISVVG